MAKKKRRRLKKSVRRGCGLVLAMPIVVCLFFLAKGVRNFWASRDAGEAEDSTEQAEALADLASLSDRLDRLFQSPQRIDTSRTAIEVYDIGSQTIVYSRHANRLAPPASCMKLLTAVTAMQLLGTDHRYVSEVTTLGEQQGNVLRGIVRLQMDDDPMLETLEPMVDAIRRQGIAIVEGDIELCLAREDTLRAHASAATWDIPYNRLPILLKGRPRIEQDLRYLLSLKGITLRRQSVSPSASTERVIYRHETPLTDVLAPMLIHSSNIKADALFHHIGRVGCGLPLVALAPEEWLLGQAVAVCRSESDDWRRFVINDGSGLSPDNRLTARFLVRLLDYVWQREPMRRVLLDEALATPGHPVRHGSLLGRMSAPVYRNRIFVKTGTLTTRALSSLAGYAQTTDGRWLVFAIINEESPVAESRIFQDRVCGELVK